MVMHTLPADLTKNPVFRVIPLKGARESGEGRLVSLSPSAARALAVYLRARRHHKLADSDWVWLGTRGRGRFANTGIRKMLVRRRAGGVPGRDTAPVPPHIQRRLANGQNCI
jgi:integrase